MHYQFAKRCTKAATFRVALICDNKTTVFCMNDVFEVLSKLHVYVYVVRTIPMGFKTKLNTFFAKPWFGRDNTGMREEIVCIFARYS